jgi:hypothetical protein
MGIFHQLTADDRRHPASLSTEPIYFVCDADAAVPFVWEKMSVAVPLVGLPMKVARRNAVKMSVFLI